jgi:hypothetical protein
MNIKTDDMVTVANVFKESFEHCISGLTGETQTLALRFVAEVILREKPYMLVTTEGLDHAMELVFGREENRDFILTLAFTFFARLGHDDDFVKGLAGNLARGAALASKADLNAVPDPIKGRLAELKDVQELLEANSWLMVVLLLQLFITVKEPADQKK